MNRTLTPSELQLLLATDAPITLLDVRRAAAHAEDPGVIPGAVWHDPECFDQWINNLDVEQEIVLYCAHGESISNTVVDGLLSRGFKARFIEGGLDAWRAAGGTIQVGQ